MTTAMWVAGAEVAGLGPADVVANPATEEPLAEVPRQHPTRSTGP